MNAKGITYLAAVASFAAAISANAADTTQTKQAVAQADKAHVSAPVRKTSEEKSQKIDKQYAAFWSQITRESGS